MYLEIKDNSFIVLDSKPLIFNKDIRVDRDTLFETIRLRDGEFFNLELHQQRVNFSYKELFKSKSKLNLSTIFKSYPKEGLYRVKVIYNKDGLLDISYTPYKKKRIKSIALVEVGNIEYSFKFLDRRVFDSLYKRYPNFDEFIITTNGYLRDTTIANIALFSKDWITPTYPLLKGVMRQKYLNEKRLIKKMIHYSNLKEYSKIATLNAMVDFNILKEE